MKNDQIMELFEQKIKEIREQIKFFDDLDLSVRSYKCLKAAKVASLHDLVNWTEADLRKFRNFGPVSLQEIKDKLAERGLSLKSES